MKLSIIRNGKSHRSFLHWNFSPINLDSYFTMARKHRHMMGYRILCIIVIPTIYLIFVNTLAIFPRNNAGSAGNPTDMRKSRLLNFSPFPRFLSISYLCYLQHVSTTLPLMSYCQSYCNIIINIHTSHFSSLFNISRNISS